MMSMCTVISGGTRELRRKKSEELTNITGLKHETITPDIDPENPEKAIGIEAVREIKSRLTTVPSGNTRFVIFPRAELLTREAQNSMLKMLEEPSESTSYILNTRATEDLLPTVLSRCTIIDLGSAQETMVTKDDQEELNSVIDHIEKGDIPSGFRWAEKIAKDRSLAREALAKILIILEEKLRRSPDPQTAGQVRKITLADKMIAANANTRLVLENLFLK